MANHYDTLGIKKDAPPEAVKRAYKRKASQAHPDKGGSDSAMADVNRAFEVLGDPVRRLKYDQVGDDTPERPQEEEARELLMHTLSQALANGAESLVNRARIDLAAMRGKMTSNRAEGAMAARNLQKRRSRIRAKSGQNLVHALIDQQVAQIEAQLVHLDRGISVATAAIAMLDNYEEDLEQPSYMQGTLAGLLRG